MINNIIYRTTNLLNGMIYIGQHQTNDLNDGYMGSGKDLKRAIKTHDKINFKTEILFNYDNFEEMNDKEIELVNKEFVLREDTYNLIIGGYCQFPCFNTQTNENTLTSKIEFDNNTNLIGSCYKKVNCLNVLNNKTCQVSKHEFDNNNYLITWNNNKVNCINKLTNEIITVSKHEFDNNKNLVGVVTGMVNCKNIVTGKVIQTNKEDFNKNKNLVSVNSKMVCCLNLLTNQKCQVTKHEFDNNTHLIGVNSKPILTPFGKFNSIKELNVFLNDILNVKVNISSLNDFVKSTNIIRRSKVAEKIFGIKYAKSTIFNKLSSYTLGFYAL